jgi:acyl-CoA synthetase (AMP-forming)/AMP-acid ligase II
VATARPDEARDAPDGSDVLYLYTGGTTGMPKAVIWRHEDLYDALWQLTRPGQAVPDPLESIARGRRALTALPASPLMHGTALFIALQTLAGGGTLVLCEGTGFDPRRTIEAIRDNEVALLSIVGDVFARPLVDALVDDPVGLPSLKVIVSSGAQWSPAVKAELLEFMPGLRLIDSLGASEGPASQSVSTKESVGESGRFKAGGRVRVIDEEGHDVEPGSGQIGLLATVGPGPVAYLGDPEKSARTFRTIQGVRMTVPGDYATVEVDGTITFLGRGSACINTGGEKVYTEEVESVLRAHPAVHDCAVVGVPDARWGERVVALIQRAPSSTTDLAAELDRACLAALAAYKRPKDYVEVSGLGRSDAGKIDLQALRALARERLGLAETS